MAGSPPSFRPAPSPRQRRRPGRGPETERVGHLRQSSATSNSAPSSVWTTLRIASAARAKRAYSSSVQQSRWRCRRHRDAARRPHPHTVRYRPRTRQATSRSPKPRIQDQVARGSGTEARLNCATSAIRNRTSEMVQTAVVGALAELRIARPPGG